ncbi:MAG: nucleoside triphosphate pyrophosphohydrolase [Bacteroidota bacterium]|nr:nucleoside triphosphate pyrophosphohydrolase [Flavobacteriaceae bacterium]MEC7870380.1 nucleoside triphosphate pyrophosphohydrolase [Bacteroidota bacterium]|tara:strand:+ start:3323 stop:4102 length:780 start_codon:yes stop_codon:yes gene_type:complete
MKKNRKKQLENFSYLLDIMDNLRENCPWDKEQTFKTLKNLTIEETYELSEAIISNNFEEIKNELGDLLLHIIFYSKIASEKNKFDISDVISGICEKLIRRHPHVFDKKEINSNDVEKNWENIKIEEGNDSVLSGVPVSLPPLIKAKRIQEKTSNIGFDFKNDKQIIDKIKEEIIEFNTEVSKNKRDLIEEEFGDIIFSLVNYARINNIDVSYALELSNKKFIKRFKYIEKEVRKSNKKISDHNEDKLNDLWNKAKKNYR